MDAGFIPPTLSAQLRTEGLYFMQSQHPKTAQISTAYGNCHQKTVGQEQMFCHLIVTFTSVTSANKYIILVTGTTNFLILKNGML